MAVVQRGGIVGPTQGQYQQQANQQLNQAFQFGAQYALQQQQLAEQKRQAMWNEMWKSIQQGASETPTGTVSEYFQRNPAVAYKFLSTMGLNDKDAKQAYDQAVSTPLSLDAFQKLIADLRVKSAVTGEMGISGEPEQTQNNQATTVNYQQGQKPISDKDFYTPKPTQNNQQQAPTQTQVQKTIRSPMPTYTEAELQQAPHKQAPPVTGPPLNSSQFYTPGKTVYMPSEGQQNLQNQTQNFQPTNFNNLTQEQQIKLQQLHDFAKQYADAHNGQMPPNYNKMYQDITGGNNANVQMNAVPAKSAPTGEKATQTYHGEAGNATDILGYGTQPRPNIEYPPKNIPSSTESYTVNESPIQKAIPKTKREEVMKSPEKAREVGKEDLKWKAVPAAAVRTQVKTLDEIEKEMNEIDSNLKTGKPVTKQQVAKITPKITRFIKQDIKYKDIPALMNNPAVYDQIIQFADAANQDPGYLSSLLATTESGRETLFQSAQAMQLAKDPQQIALAQLKLKGELAAATAKIYRANADMKIADAKIHDAIKGNKMDELNYNLRLMELALKQDNSFNSALMQASKLLDSKDPNAQKLGVTMIRKLNTTLKSRYGMELTAQVLQPGWLGRILGKQPSVQLNMQAAAPGSGTPQAEKPQTNKNVQSIAGEVGIQ